MVLKPEEERATTVEETETLKTGVAEAAAGDEVEATAVLV